MRDMIRTLTLGAMLATGTATGAVAQTYYGNGGYGLYYGNGGGIYSDGPGYYGRHGRYLGNNDYAPSPSVPAPYAGPYGYSNNYYGSYNNGAGTSEQSGWGSGGGAAYDRGYNRGY